MNIESIDWYRDIDDSDLDYVEESLKIDFAVAIEHAMKDRGINKSEMATNIQSSPAYITKVLKGDANVTIATMAKLSHALDYCVHIVLARKNHKVRWVEVIEGGKEASSIESYKKEITNIWARDAYKKNAATN